MAFDPNEVEYLDQTLQKVFDEHGRDWGVGGLGWSKQTKLLLKGNIQAFLVHPTTVRVHLLIECNFVLTTCLS
jgi:hypothetical protein